MTRLCWAVFNYQSDIPPNFSFNQRCFSSSFWIERVGLYHNEYIRKYVFTYIYVYICVLRIYHFDAQYLSCNHSVRLGTQSTTKSKAGSQTFAKTGLKYYFNNFKFKENQNKLASSVEAIAIFNLKLSITDPLTHTLTGVGGKIRIGLNHGLGSGNVYY